jgi:Ca-activated chloride channel family protein
MITQLHFLRPWWLLMLLPLTIIGWRLITFTGVNNNWRKICDPQLLRYLLIQKANLQSRWPITLLLLAWLCSTLALAGPSWSRLPTPVYRSLHGVVIVFDLTPNMFARDIKPTRLARAKYKLIDLLRGLQGNQVGLTAFSGDAYTISPLTQDAHTINTMVPEMSPNIMPTIGNNIAKGLQQGATLLKRGGAPHGTLILITGTSANTAAITEAKKLASDGIKLDVLGIGTAAGSPIAMQNGEFLKTVDGNLLLAKLDVNSLRQLANAGNGQYINFSDGNNDIQQLIKLNAAVDKQSVQSGVAKATWLDQGRWLIILIALLALAAFRKGWFEEMVS